MVIMWTSQCLNMILQISSFTPLYNTSPINLNVVESFKLLHQYNAVKYVDSIILIIYSIKSKLAAVFAQNRYLDNMTLDINYITSF